MNVDDIARRASQELRDVVGAEAGAGLAEFRRLAVRRQRRHAAAAAGAVAAVLLLAAGAVQWAGRDPGRVTPPVSNMTPPPEQSGTGFGCEHPRISCLGGDRYTVHGDVDMTWTLPVGFKAPYSPPGPTGAFVESDFDGVNGGVAVVHHVSAGPTSATRPVGGVDEAAELIDWLSERPFVVASNVERVSVDGRPAWTVEVHVPDSRRPGPTLCNNRIPCYPFLHWDDGGVERMAGVWQGMRARYTALDLHGSGITVIWTWSFVGEIDPAVERAADSIRFE